MQPLNPQSKQPGSFTKPESLVKAIAEHETKKPSAPKEQQADPLPTPPPEEPVVKTELETAEENRKKQLTEFKKNCETTLGVEITDDDLRNYLFKGLISKEVRLSKLMNGTFQTLRTTDLQSIDEKMSLRMQDSKLTSKGLANEEAIVTLSYAWTHAAGKSLGITPEEREEKIRKMGSLFVETAADARIKLESLVKIALNEEISLKK